HLLRDDPEYGPKAQRIVSLTRDLAEWLPQQLEPAVASLRAGITARGDQRIAFHPPCTLQHGQGIRGAVERLLVALGVAPLPVAESHLCCGSAGTYSILQPELSTRLRDRKLANLQAGTPQLILSANVGCLAHLQSGTGTPVRHWIEWLDEMMSAAS
ncbi:MAG TPA: heterodisulfide reductase-related iron-sulfur binding cluster, partial [Burkholderiaceae bacterium]|nr:heterodisulfide reductase-related iron-sulfur binding cluster [Burkholderiaceae bacterium]